MKPKISVIIPVYNVENYLNYCIDSILLQTFTNFELLLIDDGSLDRSSIICDEYAEKDVRVRAFHKTNGGVSSARNLGIELSLGEWIVFIDSDDVIGADYLRNFNIDEYPNKDLYLIKGFEKGGDKKIFFSNAPTDLITVEDAITGLIGVNGLCLAVWGKMFKKTILNKYKIRFVDKLSFCEDLIFCFNYFKHINTVYVSDDCSYYYRQIENSLSNKIIDYRTVYKALKLHSIDYIYFQERYSDNFIINNYFASFILASGVLRIIEQIMNEVSISVKEKKKIIADCRKLIKQVVSPSKYIKLPIKQEIKLFAIMHLPYSGLELLYKME